MSLPMSGPDLGPSHHPPFAWLPLAHRSSCSIEVTSTKRLLDCPDWPPSLCLPSPSPRGGPWWSLHYLLGFLFTCLDP